jgi:hypothetical protein
MYTDWTVFNIVNYYCYIPIGEDGGEKDCLSQKNKDNTNITLKTAKLLLLLHYWRKEGDQNAYAAETNTLLRPLLRVLDLSLV